MSMYCIVLKYALYLSQLSLGKCLRYASRFAALKRLPRVHKAYNKAQPPVRSFTCLLIACLSPACRLLAACLMRLMRVYGRDVSCCSATLTSPRPSCDPLSSLRASLKEHAGA
jgi:hypothetical protein